MYNAFTERYYRFYIDRASEDPPVKCWAVDIRFNQGVKFAGWRVRDENGEWYMVMNIDLDEGRGLRRGKAYGKLMRGGVREEDVVMTAEEGAKLGCFVERRTIEEQREAVERAKQMIRLEGALLQVSICFYSSLKRHVSKIHTRCPTDPGPVNLCTDLERTREGEADIRFHHNRLGNA